MWGAVDDRGGQMEGALQRNMQDRKINNHGCYAGDVVNVFTRCTWPVAYYMNISFLLVP